MYFDILVLEAAIFNDRNNEIPMKWLVQPRDRDWDITLYTDASTSVGVGGYIHEENGAYFHVKWSETLLVDATQKPDICFFELFEVVLAAKLYAKHWTFKTIHIYCDNWAVCKYVARKCACFRRKDLNKLIAQLCTIANEYSFCFWIDHITGDENITADALSRDKIVQQHQLEFDLAPSATPAISECNDLLTIYQEQYKIMQSMKGCKCDHDIKKEKDLCDEQWEYMN